MFQWSRQSRCLANVVYRKLTSITLQTTSSLRRSRGKCHNNRKILTKAMERKWNPPLDKATTKPPQYRLLSYNILAQELLTDNMFLYYDIDKRFLRWQYRIDQLAQEIRRLQPDILCLQEVQHEHLKEMVRLFGTSDNGQLKLEYVFKKRTERIVEYYNDDSAISNRENIALMAKFGLREDPTTRFVAATTHLLYNPRRQDVRICQIQMLLRKIAEFSENPNNDRCPVLLTGDFNCTTDSTAFRMLTAERKKVAQDPNNGCFHMEPINFGTDCASTFQNQWITVDYILQSCSHNGDKSIQINSTYNLPKLDTCRAHGKLPNKYNGSDHFSLAIQFSIV